MDLERVESVDRVGHRASELAYIVAAAPVAQQLRRVADRRQPLIQTCRALSQASDSDAARAIRADDQQEGSRREQDAPDDPATRETPVAAPPDYHPPPRRGPSPYRRPGVAPGPWCLRTGRRAPKERLGPDRRRVGVPPESRREGVEATTGFEPVNRGFADLRLRPLGYVARCLSHRRGWLPLEDSNLGSRIQSPASYH